jgi:Tol biopolymer transport system component
MPDLDELFRVATDPKEPPPGGLQRQHRLQDRRRRRARAATFGVVAVAAAVVIGVVVSLSDPTPDPAPPLGTSPQPSGAVVVPKRFQPSIVGLDGSVEDLPVDLPDDAHGLAISPDGRTIAYVTTDTSVGFCGGCAPGTRTRIAAVDLDGRHPRFLTVSRSPVSQPAWSPDGSRVAFVSGQGRSAEIFVADPTALGLPDTRPERITSNTTEDGNPTWSPDGSRILFDNSGPEPVNEDLLSLTSEIWSAPADGGPAVRLTRNAASDRAPSVAPDGRIVFSHDVRLWTLDPGSGEMGPLQGGADGWAPAWSPDGTKIVFLVYRGHREVAVDVWDPRQAAREMPILSVVVLDLETGERIDLGVEVATAVDDVSWLPSSDALFVNRVVA